MMDLSFDARGSTRIEGCDLEGCDLAGHKGNLRRGGLGAGRLIAYFKPVRQFGVEMAAAVRPICNESSWMDLPAWADVCPLVEDCFRLRMNGDRRVSSVILLYVGHDGYQLRSGSIYGGGEVYLCNTLEELRDGLSHVHPYVLFSVMEECSEFYLGVSFIRQSSLIEGPERFRTHVSCDSLSTLSKRSNAISPDSKHRRPKRTGTL